MYHRQFIVVAVLIAIQCAFASVREASAAQGEAAPKAVTNPQDSYPDISPDGDRIVFQSNRSGSSQLWLINIDGTGLTRLTHSSGDDMTPVWSPDGAKILFASNRDSKMRDIYVLDISAGMENADQSTVRIVESDDDEMHPEWADHGRKIIFNRAYPADDGADIIVANADGTGEKIVKTDRGWNTYAAMTPDAKRIVWRGTVEEGRNGETAENSEILIARADGAERIRLTADPAFDGWPAISPDGKTIAFASSRSGEAFHIYLMSIDGGEPRQITFGAKLSYTQPAWSPDGRRIAAYRWSEDAIAEFGHLVLISLE